MHAQWKNTYFRKCMIISVLAQVITISAYLLWCRWNGRMQVIPPWGACLMLCIVWAGLAHTFKLFKK